MQNLSKFGFLNALLSTLNSGNENETNTSIAKYLLQNFNNLDDLSIYDIAEGSFTTRQSVRRFCRHIGLDNFRALRKELLAMDYYHNLPSYCQGKLQDDHYPASLAQSITDMMLDVNEVSRAYRTRFCEQIHMSNECVFIVSDIYTSHCLEFQKQMILLSKMVRIVSNNFQNNAILDNLTSDDMVVVVSISGRWAHELMELIEGTDAWRTLLTALHDDCLSNEFDDVFLMSSKDMPPSKTAYHLFAIPYLLELIQLHYRELYCDPLS